MGPPAGDPALDITGSLKEREMIRALGLSIITTFEGDADALYVKV